MTVLIAIVNLFLFTDDAVLGENDLPLAVALRVHVVDGESLAHARDYRNGKPKSSTDIAADMATGERYGSPYRLEGSATSSTGHWHGHGGSHCITQIHIDTYPPPCSPFPTHYNIAIRKR